MLRLEELFRRGFLVALPLSGFIQSMADAFVSELLSRDEETGKFIYQLWMTDTEAGSPVED